MAPKDIKLKKARELNIINLYPDSRILLVEDNQVNQELAYTILTHSHYGCDIASNGHEAIRLASARFYDAIIMDLQMPDMDGYTTSDELRRRYKVEVPIIAMTAHAMPGERDKCLAHGMNDYISKPFSEEELISKLNLHIGKHREAESKEYLNLTYLKSIPGSDQPFVEQILRTFLDTTPGLLNKLSDAVSKKDHSGIRASAHTLSSNVKSLGYKNTAERLHKMEDAAIKKDSGFNFYETLEKVSTTIFSAMDEINAHLNG
jgi:CheY-like chemotaxis protein